MLKIGNFHEDMFYSAYLTYLCLKVHSPRGEIYSHNHESNLSVTHMKTGPSLDRNPRFDGTCKNWRSRFNPSNLGNDINQEVWKKNSSFLKVDALIDKL